MPPRCRRRRPRHWRQRLDKLRLASALIHRRRRVRREFRAGRAQHSHIDVLPRQGANVYDILRRDMLVLTKDAVEPIGGAPEMSRNPPLPRARPPPGACSGRYDIVRSAGDHRKGDASAREHNQVTFRVPLDATKREIKAAVEVRLQCQGEGGQHAAPRRAKPSVSEASSASAAISRKRWCPWPRASPST